MKKGFTLIELLVSIAVLSLIMLIAIPRIGDVIENSKNNAYLETINTIENAAQLYRIRNAHEFSDVVGEKKIVTLKQLQDGGYVKNEIIDPRYGNELTDADVFVTLQSNGEYDYSFVTSSYAKDNLVLWYDALWHGDNQNIWIDRSGNNKNGTLANFSHNSASGWQDDHLLFSSTSEIITSLNPIASQTVNLQSYTVFVTFNATVTTASNPRVTGINNSLYLIYNSAKALHYINGGANDYYTYSSGNTPINQVIQYAFTFNKNTTTNTMKVDLYKDGVTYAANNFAPNQSKLPLGMSANLSIVNMTGIKLYSVKVYDRVLTDDEIKQNYLTDKERFNF